MKPVVFLTFANDPHGAFLEALKPEQEAINLKLANFQKEDGIVFNSGSDINKIIEGLNAYKGQIAIFHFSGHSDGESLQLEAETEEGFQHNDLALSLKEEVKEGERLKLVFLNACNSKGILESLKKIGVPAVIATDKVIPDQTAKRFSMAFYRSMAAGNSLETAFNQAKTVISSSKEGNQIFRSMGFIFARDQEEEKERDHIPWGLYVQDEKVLRWKIARPDPLADLPDIPLNYYLKLPREPFINLQPFQKNDAAIFFGRGEEIADLYKKVKGDHPIILFHGQSGVGKSSLLYAGIFPRIEEAYQVLYVRRGEEGMLKSLTDLLQVDKAQAVLPAWRAREEEVGKALVIILDQVEEAYTRRSSQEEAKGELNELFQILSECFDGDQQKPQGKVILSYRKEYHPEIEELAYEFSLPFTELFLKKLNRAGIVEAIEGLTKNPKTQEKYGLKIQYSEEGDLAGIIADDLIADAESALAPVLQILLTRMWEDVKEGERSFSLGQYRSIKKEGYLLQDFYEQKIAELEKAHPSLVESGLALDVLNTYTTEMGTASSQEDEQVKANYSHLSTEINSLLPKLQALNLINSRGQAIRGLSHDTLAPIIQREHKTSNKDGQKSYRILESKVRNTEDLWHIFLDKEDLATVEAGRNGMRVWTEDEALIIGNSQKERDRMRKRIRLLWTSGITALIIILGISLVAAYLGFENIEFKKDGTSARLAIDSKEQIHKDLSRSLRLVEAAYAVDSLTPQSSVIASLSDVYNQTLAAKHIYHSAEFLHERPVLGAIFSHKEDKILSWSMDGSIGLWESEAKNQRLARMEHRGVKAAIFNPTDDKILTWSKKGSIKLWDLQGSLLASMEHGDSVNTVCFNSKGDRMLSSSADHSLRLWNLKGENLRSMYHEGGVNGAIFYPKGDSILSWSDDGTLRFWDLAGKEFGLMKQGDKIKGVDLDPKLDRILSWSEDGRLVIWGKNNQQQIVMYHGDALSHASFTQNGDEILSVSSEYLNVKFWSVSGTKLDSIDFYHFKDRESFYGAFFDLNRAGEILYWPYDNTLSICKLEKGIDNKSLKNKAPKIELAVMKHNEDILGASFNSKGDKILSWSLDGKLRLWHPGNLIQKVPKLDVDLDKVETVILKKDRVLFSGENEKKDSTLYLWHFQENEEKLLNMPHENVVSGAIFSKGLDTILSWSGYRLRLWNAQGEALSPSSPPMRHAARVNGAIFSPHNDKILSWDEESKVKLWDLKGQEKPIFEPKGDIQAAVLGKMGDKILSYYSLEDDKGRIHLWDLKGEKLVKWDMIHDAGFDGALLNRAEDKILSWSEDSTLFLWDVTKDSLAVRKIDNRAPITSAIFDQAGNKILSWSEDGFIQIWSLDSERLEHKIMRHDGEVWGACFNKAGDRILSWSKDSTIRLWDLKGNQILKIEGGVKAAKFNRDETKIIALTHAFEVRSYFIPEGIYQYLRKANIPPLPQADLEKYGLPEVYRR
ncbi:MAG: CHAT domain-containing protein [Bacteroidota bacterium]